MTVAEKSPKIHTCTRCGARLTVEPKHIDGLGDLGPECYQHVQGLEKVFAKFDTWLDAATASAVKNAWNHLGIKYQYDFRDADNLYGVEYRFTFVGFKQANRKPQNDMRTFKQIRAEFATKLQAGSMKRQEQVAA